jgi:hypothetical protein
MTNVSRKLGLMTVRVLTIATIVIAVITMMTVGHVQAKKHTTCFKHGSSDGANGPFDAAKFDVCGKNYEDGFMKGCKNQGNDEDSCSLAEDSQKNTD